MPKRTVMRTRPRIFRWVLPIFIGAIGLALRAVEVISGNYVFGFDQGWNYLLTREIVVEGKLRLIGAATTGFGGLFHGPGYYYLLAIPYILFRGDPYGGMILIFAAGAISLVLAYVFGAYLFGFIGGTLFLFLFAVSQPFIAQSRLLWSPNPATPLLLLSLYLFVRAIREEKSHLVPWSLFCAALLYHFHLALSVPLVITILVGIFLWVRKDRRSILRKSAVALVAGYLPAILFELRHGFPTLDNLLRLGQIQSANDHIYSLSAHFLEYWSNFVSSFRFYPVFPTAWMQAPFLLIGVLVLLANRRRLAAGTRRILSFFLLLIGITWGIFLFLNNTVWDYYLVPVQIAYLTLSVYAVREAFSRRDRIHTAVRAVFCMYLLGFAYSGGLELIRSYTDEVRDYGGTAKIQGLTEAVDFLYADSAGQPFNVIAFTPPVYTYRYDYMFLWYGKNRYGYVPGNTKEGTVYLLIEPDSTQPWSYAGWLETVIKDEGKIVYTTSLQNGFIIQKRIFPY